MWDNIAPIALDDLAPTGLILVIAPHPDDETLGCGGLIASAKDAGRAVLVVVLTDGAASHTGSLSYPAEHMAALRADELRCAGAQLGLSDSDLASLSLPDGRLADEDADALAERIGAVAGDIPIGAIFAPGLDDPHPDHRMAARAAEVLTRRHGALLWNYPIRAHVIDAFAQSPADLVRLDIACVIERKRAALNCHASQLGGLVADDPQGFQLTQADVSQHTCVWELYKKPNQNR